MNAKRIESEQLAVAAAQGIAIALSARGATEEITISRRLIAGLPADLFEITLNQVDGQLTVESVQKFEG